MRVSLPYLIMPEKDTETGFYRKMLNACSLYSSSPKPKNTEMEPTLLKAQSFKSWFHFLNSSVSYRCSIHSLSLRDKTILDTLHTNLPPEDSLILTTPYEYLHLIPSRNEKLTNTLLPTILNSCFTDPAQLHRFYTVSRVLS